MESLNSTTTTTTTTTSTTTLNNTRIIVETIRLYGSIYIICLIVYTFVLQPKYPYLFNIRKYYITTRTTTTNNNNNTNSTSNNTPTTTATTTTTNNNNSNIHTPVVVSNEPNHHCSNRSIQQPSEQQQQEEQLNTTTTVTNDDFNNQQYTDNINNHNQSTTRLHVDTTSPNIKNQQNRHNLATTNYTNRLSWIYQVLTIYNDYDIYHHTSSMDVICFLRALRFGRQLSIIGCCNAIYLIPIYYTASSTNTNTTNTDWFQLVSITNVPNTDSKRLIATIIAAYIIYIYTKLVPSLLVSVAY